MFNKATSSGSVTKFKEQKLFTHQLLGLKFHIRNKDGLDLHASLATGGNVILELLYNKIQNGNPWTRVYM